MNKKELEDISFGEWLRQRRHILDLTQQELADQVGCARITLRRIEAGALKPSRELAVILLQKLGAPEVELEAWIRFARGLSGFPTTPTGSFPGKRLTNLPTLLTSFIGREKEQQEILDLIRKYHLVTLVGLGGVGKTRLSLQAAQEAFGMFPDGVWLVDLAPILDPLLVSRTTAVTIGLREEPQRPVIDVLCDFLAEKNLLLIVDNCEHLVDACAHMAEKILQHAPNVRIVATSREALGITGEVTYRVRSLELPNLKHLPPAGLLSRYEAIALFIDRATAADSTFRLMDGTAPTLAQICSRLDGIPLAIELAAAKLGVLSLSQISERLDDRFRLLTGGSRTAAPQHQTLQAAIDWSYDLLSPSEQTLFRRLAVFVNGWTLEAAEFICSDTGTQPEDILELLTQLISKSLVNREETINKPRYRMLETIRAYALKKLEASGEMKATCLRHLIFFGRMVDEAEHNFKGPNQAIWYSRLDSELDNLRVAMTWFRGVENAEIRLQFTAGLWRYWKNRGHTSEGRRHLNDILEDLLPGPDRQTSAYARALNAAGSLAYYEGDLAYSERSRKEALAIFENLNDKAGIANCLNGLGNTAISQGNYDAALQSYEESLAIRRELGDKWGIARLLGNLGLLAYFQIDYPQARSLHSESLALFRELQDEEGMANELVNLGDVVRHQSELSLAHSFYQESAVISAKLMDQWGLGYALMGMGDVALAQDDLPGASFLYRDCLIIFQRGADYSGLPFALESVAALAFARNKPEPATQLLGAADTLRRNTNSPLPPPNHAAHRKNLSLLREQLDASAFSFAWAKGQAMTIDRAVALALHQLI